MKSILFITNDVIGDSTAGPGIRYRELGAAFARRGHRVTVMGRCPSFATPQPFAYVTLSALNLIKHVRRNDCVVFRGGGPLTTLLLMLFARRAVLVSDIYAFTQFEVPHIIPRSFRERLVTDIRKRFHVFKMQLYGEFCRHFWVANERQMHFLQGMFYGIDASPESRTITVVPFGYPSAPPERTRNAVREVMAGILRGDFLLIWGGGVWDWLDPITLVEAMAIVRKQEPRIKLLFLGIQAPSGGIPARGEQLVQKARDLGVLNVNVFINSSWVPYSDRINYLLEADAGVSLHQPSLETRYSFRTRNLDYLYCRLPMIHSDGDVWADIIRKDRIGIVVPPGDVQAVADAILRMHRDRAMLASMKQNIQLRSQELTWDVIADRATRSLGPDGAEQKPSLPWLILILVHRYSLFALQSCFAFLRAVRLR
jgi:glycosyltransferase involved in cell wall biosynthesis